MGYFYQVFKQVGFLFSSEPQKVAGMVTVGFDESYHGRLHNVPLNRDLNTRIEIDDDFNKLLKQVFYGMKFSYKARLWSGAIK